MVTENVPPSTYPVEDTVTEPTPSPIASGAGLSMIIANLVCSPEYPVEAVLICTPIAYNPAGIVVAISIGQIRTPFASERTAVPADDDVVPCTA